MSEGVRKVDAHAARSPAPGAVRCELPALSERDATSLLEVIGSGGALGAGHGMHQFGVKFPEMRAAYEEAIEELALEVERRKKFMKPRALADWAVNSRTAIARDIRARYQGLGATIAYEVRDNVKYGPGGRTPRNLRKYHIRTKRLGAHGLNRELQRSALRSDAQINKAVKGARFLRHGGRVVVVLSLSTTAYVLLTAPPDQLEKLLYEEAGGLAGGSLGAGAGVGACLLFGIATGGWGLLACGIVGGAVGGAGGALLGEQIYYAVGDDAVEQVDATGLLDPSLVSSSPDPTLVCE